MGKYGSFFELRENEVEGRDYQVRHRLGRTGIAVIAPHGGLIEPGTTEIADAVAVDEHSFYSFCGLRKGSNGDLHISSARFDEPTVLEMARNMETTLAIHGCRGEEEAVYIGGRNRALRERLSETLSGSGFLALEDTRFPGIRPENICNRNRLGMGVQLEISTGLRRLMFEGFSFRDRSRRTEPFTRLVEALRGALAEPAGLDSSSRAKGEWSEGDMGMRLSLRRWASGD